MCHWNDYQRVPGWEGRPERELWTVGTGTVRPRRREWGSENKAIPLQWEWEGGQSKKCEGECSGREGPSPHAVWLLMLKGPSGKEITTLAGGEGHLGPAGWIAGGLVFLLQPILKITKAIFPRAKSELNSCMFNKHSIWATYSNWKVLVHSSPRLAFPSSQSHGCS